MRFGHTEHVLYETHSSNNAKPDKKQQLCIILHAVVQRVLSHPTQMHMHILLRAHLLTKANTSAVIESARALLHMENYAGTVTSKSEQGENTAAKEAHKLLHITC